VRVLPLLPIVHRVCQLTVHSTAIPSSWSSRYASTPELPRYRCSSHWQLLTARRSASTASVASEGSSSATRRFFVSSSSCCLLHDPANATRSVEHDDVLITAVNDPFIEPHYAVSDPPLQCPRIRRHECYSGILCFGDEGCIWLSAGLTTVTGLHAQVRQHPRTVQGHHRG